MRNGHRASEPRAPKTATSGQRQEQATRPTLCSSHRRSRRLPRARPPWSSLTSPARTRILNLGSALPERGPVQIAARPSPSAEWTTFRFEPRAPGGYASAWMGQLAGISRRCVGWRPAAAAAGKSDRRAPVSLSRSDPKPESPIPGASPRIYLAFQFLRLNSGRFLWNTPLFVSGVVHNSFFFFSFLFALVVRRFSFVWALGIELGSGASRSTTCVLNWVRWGLEERSRIRRFLSWSFYCSICRTERLHKKWAFIFVFFSSSRLSFKDTT